MVFGFSGVGIKRPHDGETQLRTASDDLTQYISSSSNGVRDTPKLDEAYEISASAAQNGELALHACSSCKKQKRKCTKELPKCFLCARMSRECNYEDSCSPTPSPAQLLQARVRELEQELVRQQEQHEAQIFRNKQFDGSNYAARQIQLNPFERFPASFFLDHEIFEEARLTIPQPSLHIPQEVYSLLGTIDDLRNIAGRFFTTTHSWFPFLSRKRFEIMLANPNFVPKPEVSALFVAMHLITNVASNCEGTVRSNLYWTAKNYLSTLEINNVMVVQLLQANVLVALYELGHAIYPAAYLSIGKCSSMGKAFGLDNPKHSPQMLKRVGAWAELEETRRLWWAILTLDRYVHLCFPGHGLNTDEPSRNEVLPADDDHFDKAEMAGNEPLYIASPTTLKAGPFTRTCQAGHLVGRVVNVLNDLLQESETRFTTALQLHRTLAAFIKVIEADFNIDPERYATPMALAYSAFIAICDPFCCTLSNRSGHTVEETELQTLCIAGIKTVSDSIARFVQKLKPSMTVNQGSISPLLGYSLYMATITFAWRVYEGENDGCKDRFHICKDALSTMNGRWAVADQYLEMVDRTKDLLYPDASKPQLIAGPPGMTA